MRAGVTIRGATPSKMVSAETSGRAWCLAVAARSRANGSLWLQSITPAATQIAGSRPALRPPRAFEKCGQFLYEGVHLRPLAQADLLRDLEEGDGAHEDGVSRIHGPERGL
jgi:hypothetical protein